jgi:ABC-type amino acid transport substrate-binding protein/signal transduction histidine kinase
VYKYFLLLLLLCNTLFANILTNLTTEEKEFIKNNPIINVGAETDWPPFDYVENGKYKGIAKDYLEIIEKKTGLKFNYIYGYKWNDLLQMAFNKEIDLLPILSKTPNREKNLIFTSNSYITIKDYLYSTNKTYNTLNDLKDKSIVIEKGYVNEDFIKNNYPKIKIITVNNTLEAINLVITEKAEALISNIPQIEYLTKKNNISILSPTFVINTDNNLFMAFRNDYSILKSILDKALESINQIEKNDISLKWIDSYRSINEYTLEEKEFIGNHKTLNIANEMDWIPYDYYENEKAKGYAIDYVKLILSKTGMDPIFVSDGWSNLLEKFSDKEIDVFPAIGFNEERAKIFNYTQSYINQELSIITKKNKFDLINIDDLAGKKLAMVKGWNSTERLKENYAKINIIEFETLKEVFESVENNTSDATIQDSLIANYYINKSYFNSLKILTKVNINNFDSKLYMGVSKDLEVLPEILNKAINKVSLIELETLDKKWFNSEKSIIFSKEEQEFIDKKTINIAFTDNWAPINFVEKNKYYGLAYDFWQYIADKANLKTTITVKHNFTEALNSIENKTSDIIVATTKTSDREKYAIFSDRYYKAPIGIATLQDKNYIPDASHLVGKKVGVGKNYSAYKILEKQYPAIDFVFIENIEKGLSLLSNNNIYALIDNLPVLTYNIQKYAYSNIKISGTTGIDFDLQMMIRDDYKVLQSIVNKVLETMDPNDKNLIYNRWLKLEYYQTFDYSILWKYFLPLVLIILIILYKNRQLLIYQKKLKSTKEELENTLRTFRSLVNLTIEGIIIVSDNKIIYHNYEFLKIFDINEKKLLNNSFYDLFDMNNIISITDIIKNANTQTYETIGLKNFETKFPILIKSKKVTFENKLSTILSIIDMSEIKNKENLLIQQSKMASMGEMIGNIAHQWRQPLSLISTAASGMKIQKEFNQLDDKTFDDTLDSITNTTMFLSQTIDDFQNYLKDDKEKKEFDVNTSINKILNIIKGSFINHSINVILDLQKDLLINSYENELNQALLNILNNAKDALKEIDKENRYINIKSYKNKSETIIEITDNAGGIKEEIINKIFEPYFTTKHKSQGTGLGLYMTHKIITSSMNGDIKITNVKHTFSDKFFDKCTNVKITFPLS